MHEVKAAKDLVLWRWLIERYTYEPARIFSYLAMLSTYAFQEDLFWQP
jgi:hypothetical protein